MITVIQPLDSALNAYYIMNKVPNRYLHELRSAVFIIS